MLSRSGDWLMLQHGGRKGLFPANYTEAMTTIAVEVSNPLARAGPSRGAARAGGGAPAEDATAVTAATGKGAGGGGGGKEGEGGAESGLVFAVWGNTMGLATVLFLVTFGLADVVRGAARYAFPVWRARWTYYVYPMRAGVGRLQRAARRRRGQHLVRGLLARMHFRMARPQDILTLCMSPAPSDMHFPFCAPIGHIRIPVRRCGLLAWVYAAGMWCVGARGDMHVTYPPFDSGVHFPYRAPIGHMHIRVQVPRVQARMPHPARGRREQRAAHAARALHALRRVRRRAARAARPSDISISPCARRYAYPHVRRCGAVLFASYSTILPAVCMLSTGAAYGWAFRTGERYARDTRMHFVNAGPTGRMRVLVRAGTRGRRGSPRRRRGRARKTWSSRTRRRACRTRAIRVCISGVGRPLDICISRVGRQLGACISPCVQVRRAARGVVEAAAGGRRGVKDRLPRRVLVSTVM